MKYNYLINGAYVLPSCKEYLMIDLTNLYDYERDLFIRSGKVSVINTCIFVLCDFAPRKFYAFLSNKKDEFMI